MEFALPEIGEGVYEAELLRWYVKPGDTVKRGQDLLEVMTDKASMQIPSPFVGAIEELRAEPGQQIKVGQVLLTYTAREQPVAAEGPVKDGKERAVPTAAAHHNGPTRSAAPAVVREEPAARLPIKASPSVRHLARKLGIDLSGVHGSGPEGRILLDDLAPRMTPGAAGVESTAAAMDYGKPGSRIKLQGLRRRIAEHMAHAKRTIPHYSYIDECDATELVRLREQVRPVYARQGIKLTYLAFIVKAVVAALKEVPIVNASLDEAAGEIVLHDRYDIGIAVATPAGLIVPVVREADRKDVGTLAREIERLSQDARVGRSRREELRGGTFTVTSVGNLGGLISTPVINHPEVGILGIGKIVKRPVFDAAGQVRAADLVYLSFSFDHRVVDGAVGAAFANVVLRELQQPARLLI